MNTQVEVLSNESLQTLVPSAFAVTPHSSRSNRYAFIPTSDVIQGMAEAGFFPVSAKQSSSRDASKQNFTKHMIRFRSLDPQFLVGDSAIETILINSHDGTSRYKLMMGVIRFICENGLIVADAMVGSINIMHTGNIVREVVESTRRIFEQAPVAANAIQTWSQIDLQPREQLYLAEAAHEVRFPRNEDGTQHKTPITPEMLLRSRRSEDDGHDLYSTFNRIQENSLKGFRTTVPNPARPWRRQRVGTRGINSINEDVKLNRALWSLATKMAELKGEGREVHS